MKRIIFVLVIITFLLIGCSKDDDSFSIPDTFTMNFLKNYIRDSGWAILQIEDITVAQEIPGDLTINFENIDLERGTVTIIQNYYQNNQQRIRITQYLDVLLGEWFLKGFNFTNEPLGTSEVTLTFPEEEYTQYMISSSSSFHAWFSSPIGSELTKTIDNYYLNSNQTNTFFNVIINADTGLGYCDWGIDLPFVQNEINEYTFVLDKEMQSKLVSVNRPIDNLRIIAYRNGMQDCNFLDYENFGNDPVTEFYAFYAEEFPHEKYDFIVRNFGENEYYYYNEFVNEIPSEVIIPEGSISADYNIEQNKFENIAIDGDADQVSVTWSYSTAEISVYVSVCSETSVEEINFPEIPSGIIEDLEIDLSLLSPSSIGIQDYDTADDFDDSIDIQFREETPFIMHYNKSYIYSKYFTPESSRIMEDFERDDYFQ